MYGYMIHACMGAAALHGKTTTIWGSIYWAADKEH